VDIDFEDGLKIGIVKVNLEECCNFGWYYSISAFPSSGQTL
jgi:hypothetical protein